MKKLKKFLFTIIVLILFFTFSTFCYGADNIYKGTSSEINASNCNDGYIKIKYLKPTTKNLKVIIENNSTKYTYDLNSSGEYDAFPLQMGNGKYKIKVFENITDNKYSLKQSVDIDVKLNNTNSPFLVANKLVNFSGTSDVVKKAHELTEGIDDEIEKLDVIYNYIITNIVYDTEKAKNVKSGYVPDVDEILKSNKGICFDYASIMAAMLRSEGIPAKLVTGYSSNLSVFHAWNEVYTDETGWIVLNQMYFDGNQWNLMDSTIASTAKQSNSPKVIEYTNKLINAKYYTKQFEY
nr:transglutaminase-like domain-containing protein [Sedimentibacter sp.]